MIQNLLTAIPAELPEELVTVLNSTGRVRIERIVSRGQASPPGFWYDQTEEEFVLLVQGRAKLEFADGVGTIELRPGDCLTIPSGRRHRVAWTDPAQDTVWLAVFYPARQPAEE